MKKKALKKGVTKYSTGLPIFNKKAAGIDIGDTLHCTSIQIGEEQIVLETGTFTCDLEEIVKFLKKHKIETVAMESTGVYWIPLFLMIQAAEIEVYLVNAKHTKNVSGRKRDDTDAMWIQKLHSCGLLQRSFQPDNQTRKLRDFTRHRARLVRSNASIANRLQKALELMNIKTHTVISDILGKTGILIIEAILKGERNPDDLVKLCDPRIKASPEKIKKSLVGIYKEEYIFELQQCYDQYRFTLKQINDCDQKIKEHLREYVAIVNQGDITQVESVKKKRLKKK